MVKRKALPALCQKLPYAVELFVRVFQTQKSLTQLSFYPAGGQSKLSLQPWMGHLELAEVDTWGTMDSVQQKAHTLLFHKGQKFKPAKDVPISSKDDTVTMLNKSKSAKKPGSSKNKAGTPVVKVDKTKRDPSAGRKKRKLDDQSQDDDFDNVMGNQAEFESAAEDTAQEESPIKSSEVNRKLSPQKKLMRENAEKKRKTMESAAEDTAQEEMPIKSRQVKRKLSPKKKLMREHAEKVRRLNKRDAFKELESDEENFESEGKKLPVRRKLITPSQSNDESSSGVVEKRVLRHRNPKKTDLDTSDEEDIDTLVKKAKEKKAALLEKENKDKWWAGLDDDDIFETPKPTKRESKRPKHLEDFHVSSQKKNKDRKGKKNKEKFDSMSLMEDALEGLGVKKKQKK